jgi:hypothetical protein
MGSASLLGLGAAPAVASIPTDSHDAALLEQYAVVCERWEALRMAYEFAEGRKEAMEADPDYVPPATYWEMMDGDPEGKKAANHACSKKHGREVAWEGVDETHIAYGKASTELFRMEAQTIEGAVAKLYFAALAAVNDDACCFMTDNGWEDRTDWLYETISDLERIGGAS